MARVRLSLGSLVDLNFGEVEGTFKMLLKQIVDDIEDRKHVAKPRKIVMTLHVVPEPNQRGQIEKVVAGFTIKPVMPPHELSGHQMRIGSGHELIFSSQDPENADQSTIDELIQGPVTVDPDTGEVRPKGRDDR